VLLCRTLWLPTIATIACQHLVASLESVPVRESRLRRLFGDEADSLGGLYILVRM
jgi:hypothetical protein